MAKLMLLFRLYSLPGFSRLKYGWSFLVMGKLMKKVGLLGGTFDPVHMGHLALAAEALKNFRLERILFIPANQSPHKQDHTPASPHHRLAMLQRAVASEPDFQVQNLELERKGVSFTIDTLHSLRQTFPGTEFYLIMGIDTFKNIDTWKDAAHLIQLCHILVATRPGFIIKEPGEIVNRLFSGDPSSYMAEPGETKRTVFLHRKTGRKLIFFDIAPWNVSSREIRSKIRNLTEIKNMLPLKVENYIMKNNLYRAQSIP